jgi:hypothetical protein
MPVTTGRDSAGAVHASRAAARRKPWVSGGLTCVDPARHGGVDLASGSAMDCRIQVTHTQAGLTVRLAGRLGAPHVCELLRLCSDTADPLRLDLAHLRSIDFAGVHALRRLRSEGVNLIGAPRCIRRKVGPIRCYGVTGARLWIHRRLWIRRHL